MNMGYTPVEPDPLLKRQLGARYAMSRLYAIIQAGGDAIAAIRLGKWWIEQVAWASNLPLAPGAKITASDKMILFGVPVVLSDDEYEIEPLGADEVAA